MGQPEKRSIMYTRKCWPASLKEVGARGSTLERAGRHQFDRWGGGGGGLRGVVGKAFCNICNSKYGLLWIASRPPVGPGAECGLCFHVRSAAHGGPVACRVSHT